MRKFISFVLIAVGLSACVSDQKPSGPAAPQIPPASSALVEQLVAKGVVGLLYKRMGIVKLAHVTSADLAGPGEKTVFGKQVQFYCVKTREQSTVFTSFRPDNMEYYVEVRQSGSRVNIVAREPNMFDSRCTDMPFRPFPQIIPAARAEGFAPPA